MKITKEMIAAKIMEETPELKGQPINRLPFIDEIMAAITAEPSLEQNVIEWICDQPLSDVVIHDLSINMILDAWGGGPFTFAMLEMGKYIDRNYTLRNWAFYI